MALIKQIMKHQWIYFDKVTYVVIGTIILLPCLVIYIWVELPDWTQITDSPWLKNTIILSSVIGILLSYKRNSNVCVRVTNAEVTGVSLEFGTVSPLEVFKPLRVENWLYHYEKVKREEFNTPPLFKAFYPDYIDWKMSVWLLSRNIIGVDVKYYFD